MLSSEHSPPVKDIGNMDCRVDGTVYVLFHLLGQGNECLIVKLHTVLDRKALLLKLIVLGGATQTSL